MQIDYYMVSFWTFVYSISRVIERKSFPIEKMTSLLVYVEQQENYVKFKYFFKT